MLKVDLVTLLSVELGQKLNMSLSMVLVVFGLTEPF